MRSSWSFGVFLLLVLASAAGAAPEIEGEVFGAGVGDVETVSTLELLDSPENYVGKTLRVEGEISDVCPRRGCWIDIAGKGDSRSVRFKVQDDVIVFPVTLKGRRVVAQGVFAARELDREATIRWERHLADERGEEFDPASVEGPRTYYQIEGAGAVVRSPTP